MAGFVYTEAQLSVACAFRDVRRAAGLKQAELAAMIGKHQSYISDIERGQRRIDVLELWAIAKAMGLNPTEMYDELTRLVPSGFSF